VNWTELAQVRVHCWALVMMNIGFIMALPDQVHNRYCYKDFLVP